MSRILGPYMFLLSIPLCLDNTMLLYLMGSLRDGVTIYNIDIWLSVKY